jgi:hypothetical protein
VRSAARSTTATRRSTPARRRSRRAGTGTTR